MECSSLFYAAYEFAHQEAGNTQVHQGGTSSGKTYSILQALFTIAAESKEPLIITVVGQDIPNLKAGALRDALDIYNNNPEIKSCIKSYNKADRIFEFVLGSIMEFKSYDGFQDAKSGKRHYLFINEANGIPFPVYSELALRTKNKVFIDYNPNAEFWVHEFLLGKPGVELVLSDHRDNPFIDQRLRDKIEALKEVDKELWKVYARGLTGRIEGLVFKNFSICDEIPKDAKFIAAGLDFGFTNDQTGCINVYMQDGELWVEELFYETGLTNPDIALKFAQCGFTKDRTVPGIGQVKGTKIIADSAEPKSIEELYRLRYNVQGALKGPDSIKASIDILKRYHINITRSSVNFRKEIERYTWKKDKKTNKSLQEPIDEFNHLIDPLRYVALNCLKIRNSAKPTSKLPAPPSAPYIGISKDFFN